MFRCLGIESSCDETAAAVVEDGTKILSNVVKSQIDIHTAFGGVVPEVACRSHMEAIGPVVEKALSDAELTLDQIDAIAVTHAPGLVGALLVGVSMAKALSVASGIPLIGVDHIYGHMYANRFAFPDAEYPIINLVVSGGHSSIYLSRSEIDHDLLGSTVDDAAGEAFDKVAKILELGFPGGPHLDKAARGRDPKKVYFKRTYPEEFDFSFSGIKTGVLYHVRGQKGKGSLTLSPDEIADVAAGFQEAVVDMLTKQTIRAAKKHAVPRIAVGGGVACNSRLREKLTAVAKKEGMEAYFPPPKYCTDNAVMIAGIAWPMSKAGLYSDLALDAVPTKVYRATRAN